MQNLCGLRELCGDAHPAAHDMSPSFALLSPWPIRRTTGWVKRVHEPLTAKELDEIRT